MFSCADVAAAMRAILGLEGSPIAVKFLEQDELDGYDRSARRRFCQALMEARAGRKVMLTPANLVCPAAAAALGFKPLPAPLASGQMLVNFGIFGTAEAGQKTIEAMPRLAPGQYAAVALAPLEAVDFDPDVVVVEDLPERLMWLALAAQHEIGGRLKFSTGILQATCVDGAIVPFQTGQINASMGCYGCRDATDMPDTHAVLGIPGPMLETVAANLEKLARKAIPHVRQKLAYRQLEASGDCAREAGFSE
ncbi:MAG: DUF169 domain-containing protein [Armatimonadota bacterium]|nr:DUF169 domain-containing protein [Armatimonadota bacterium]